MIGSSPVARHKAQWAIIDEFMEKKKLTEVMAHKGGNVNVYGKGCFGCERHEADIMVSVSDSDGNIFDLFLTSAQALRLADKLGKEIGPISG